MEVADRILGCEVTERVLAAECKGKDKNTVSVGIGCGNALNGKERLRKNSASARQKRKPRWGREAGRMGDDVNERSECTMR